MGNSIMRPWIVITVFFAACGIAFFAARLRGYRYIGAAFLLAAFCLVTVRLFPSPFMQIILVLIAAGLIYFFALEAMVLKNRKTDPEPERKYLVVLGAEVDGTVPSLSLFHRLQAALDYLSKYPGAKAVVCGGRGEREQISEAECMFRWLTENGIDADRILLEDRSVSTDENLRFALGIILSDGGTASDAAILSSPYHLYRAKLMAAKYGFINAAGVACVHGYPVFTLGMYIREAFGITHFRVFGR